jgi:UDP-2,3-diacylglucosamine pyrophosphatase LpxH
MYKKTTFETFKHLLNEGKTKKEILQSLPISERTYYYWKKKLSYNVPEIPKDRGIKEVIKLKKEIFKNISKKENYYKEVPVKFESAKPIGLLFMGDPHIDNPATDLSLFETHLNLAKSNEDVYVLGMGDYLDNWVGYLSKMFNEQHITFEEGIELIKYYFKNVPFLAMILGNHDLWERMGYFFKEIFDDQTIIGEDIRLKLQWQDCDPVFIHIRHAFKGKSQYNPAFPLVKQAVFNYREDIIAMGHMHQTGYQIYPQPEGYISHCFVVGSYKRYDNYGKSLMTHETNLAPAIFVTIEPYQEKTKLDRIKVFFDVFEGINYLNYLKKKMQ